MRELITLEVRSRRQWRAWLAKQHTSSPGVWLVFYKTHTGVKSIVWIHTAKRPETRERRIRESIALLPAGQKLGLK